VSALLNTFIEDSLGLKRSDSGVAQQFLKNQLKEYDQKLRESESRLAEFKKANVGLMPGPEQGDYYQRLDTAMTQLDTLRARYRQVGERRNELQRQLNGEEPTFGLSGPAGGSPIDAQIAGYQARIDQLLVQYTDKHPEVITLGEELKHATAELANARGADGGPGTLQADPMYRQKLQERDNARLTIRDLQRSSQRVQTEIGQYQSRVDAAPMVEQELASLTREYEFEKRHYADLSSRHQQASIAEDLTRKQGGERFSVLFPANLPNRPLKPDQLRIMAMAIAAGLVLGAAAAVGREFLDRSVHDARALNEFDVPVLGEIPRIPA